MPALNKLQMATCLWFDGNAEEAANYYVSIFPNSRVTRMSRHPLDDVATKHGLQPNCVVAVEFLLDGHKFVALNGGSEFKFNEAVSLQIECDTQEEIDYYWEKLTAGGDEKRQVCGWLADKYGLSWQVNPKQLMDMLAHEDKERAARVMSKMMEMTKLDLAALQKAFDGN